MSAKRNGNVTAYYLNPVDKWRVEQYRTMQGLDSASASVRDLVKLGWDLFMAAKVAKAAPNMPRMTTA